MKKILAFLLALSINSYSQNIGLELGVGSSKAKVSDGTTSISSDTYSGFLAGLVIDFEYSKSLKLETGLSFGFLQVDGESSNSWGVPLTLKYYYNKESRFHLRTGIAYSSSLEDVDTSIVKKDALSAEFGLGYDINNNLSLVAGYSTQLSNSAGPQLDGLSVKGSSFGMGLQYFFD